MNLRRALPLAMAMFLSAAGMAAAQGPPQCMKDFVPLRDDATKKAAAIRAASERKVPPAEACSLFKVFVAAEAKVIKYARDNATWCGIPPDAIAQMKKNHDHSLALRTQVCKVAAAPQRPAAPSLSDALGAPNAAAPDTIKPGRGTFDTLTGTPLGAK